MLKRWTALALCLAAVLGLAACHGGRAGGSASEASEGGKLRVSVTFNAMKEFVQAVGGDRVEISTIIPDGTEPHDFEPKAQDLVGLSMASIFVYNGLGMEAWAEDAVAAAKNDGLIAVEASSGAQTIAGTDGGELTAHGQYDPHVWLSLRGAAAEAVNIRDALVTADPANADYYRDNCDSFTAQLGELYDKYDAKFRAAERKTFVTGHAAFAYLCRDFGLTQNSVEDVFAEGEPGARQLSELVDYCRANGVTTIFAEKMASPEISETLAAEVGARVETIYTIESAEDGMTYLERMEANLSKICGSLTA